VKQKQIFRMPRTLRRRGGKPGRPPANLRPKFTPEQIEIAVQVTMFSKVISNWVISEAEFTGVNLDSPEGKKFFAENARKAALRLLK